MYDNKIFWRIFSKRSAISFFILMLLFLSCILRVAAIATSDYETVRQSQNTLKITLSKQRGTIYDCNMIPITNRTEKIIAAVSPTPRAITAISSVLSDEEFNTLSERLKSNKPVLCEVPKEIKCDGIVCTKIYVNQDGNTPAVHLIGYTDADNTGVSGLQSAYDNILSGEEISVSYECDGKGNILEGAEPVVKNSSSDRVSGIVTTLDINIQNIAENASSALECGAIVIAEAKTGKIRASVSRPYFDCTKISDYLSADDSPLLNRAINAYSVGSVFKPCVAISSIESQKSNFTYTCTGSCEIIDRFFRCHKYDGHGLMKLQTAIANSCNTYFYNLAFNLGGEAIWNKASALRFGKSLKLCDGIYTAAGNMPPKEELNNIAHLANFSIGQGELLLSPISILTLYCAIAYDGTYTVPSLVEATVRKGSFTQYENDSPTRVMSADTAEIMRRYLTSVLTEGTGESAIPDNVTAAGKTATAQTGKYENGVEICQGWFCGFFPAEAPEYVVAVFSENTARQTASCGEIFASVASDITKLKK